MFDSNSNLFSFLWQTKITCSTVGSNSPQKTLCIPCFSSTLREKYTRKFDVRSAVHSWAKRQKPAKSETQKVREIDGSYLYQERFDKFWIWRPRKDRKWKLWACRLLHEKTREITLRELIFGWFLAILSHCSARTERVWTWTHRIFMCGEKILVKTRDVSLTLVSFGAVCSNLWPEIWKTDPFLKVCFSSWWCKKRQKPPKSD